MARERIDLRAHEGAHPRVGAADVVPIVPLVPEDMARAERAADAIARRLAADCGVPVFMYAPPERGPAFFRRGGTDGLQARIDAGELAPDHGPPRLHESAGAVLVGARRPLIAFNVNLRGELAARARSRASCASAAAASPACARSASTCRAPVSSRSR